MQNYRTWNILKIYFLTTLLIIVPEYYYKVKLMFGKYNSQGNFIHHVKINEQHSYSSGTDKSSGTGQPNVLFIVVQLEVYNTFVWSDKY